MSTIISWTDETWNPATGCSRVSPGCQNCYAENMSLKRGWSAKPWTIQNVVENVRLHPDRLRKPLGWREPKRVFTNSMSDMFHEQIPFEFIAATFGVMAHAQRHTFQVLTKRPKRGREFFAWLDAKAEQESAVFHFDVRRHQVCRAAAISHGVVFRGPDRSTRTWPCPNVWLGTSVEDQRRANERIPSLLMMPAAVHFLSCEPLLEAVDLSAWLSPSGPEADGLPCADCGSTAECDCEAGPVPLDWVIVGGESGPGFRPMELAWARALRDQCVDAGVAYFFKQQASFRTETRPWLTETDGRSFEWHQYPGDLQVPREVKYEFPLVRATQV